MPMVEVDTDTWIRIGATKAEVHYGEDDAAFAFARVPALSRALSIVKESKQYAAWLKKAGLA